MSAAQTETSHPSNSPVFNRIGENLYPLESSGVYYALLKHGGKQIRKSMEFPPSFAGK